MVPSSPNATFVPKVTLTITNTSHPTQTIQGKMHRLDAEFANRLAR